MNMDMSSTSGKAAAEYLTEGRLPRPAHRNDSLSPFEGDKTLSLEELLKQNANLKSQLAVFRRQLREAQEETKVC